MIDKNKGKGGGEFDDNGLEGEDFDDAYFDETVEDAGIEDLPSEEGDLGDEDFEAEDWQDEEVEDAGKKGKKAKKDKPVKSGEKKKMSSNTLIIMGAVVLGVGVMLFNLSKPPAGGAAGAKPVDNFKSPLNIGGIMDGTLLGDKPKDLTAENPVEEDQGFLTKVPEETNPPQPTPIAPEDTSLALTPMPGEEGAAPSVEAPRGPDDTVPAANGEQIPVVPITTDDSNASVTVEATPAVETPAGETPPEATASPETPSAQDILSKAIAERSDDQAGDIPAEEAKSEETAAAEETKTEDVKAEEKPAEAAVEIPVAETPSVAVVDAEEVKALESKLEGKIDELLKRMETIETDLNNVREAKGDNTKDIEESVQSLKEEIAELRSRPAAEAPEKKAKLKKAESNPEPLENAAIEETVEEAAPAPVPAPKKAAAAKPAPTSQWELRAAQPGRAWVSPQGSRDMQSVVVGDTLAGIGKVTGIVYQNGQWTIQGTQGAIHQ